MTSRPSLSLLIVVVALSSACAKTGSPTSPSSGALPSLGLACPAQVVTESLNGSPVPTTYEAPTEDPPIDAEVACAPASGSAFPVGTNTVTCATTNTKQAPTCEFTVLVKPPPTLTKTRFVAFGDSITDGVLNIAGDAFDPAGDPISYPFRLQGLLDARYQIQSTTVINAGLGGETTAEGRGRLPSVLDRYNPDVLLLLEGINDIRIVTADSIKADLRAMVQNAKGRGITVLLATLTPVADNFEQIHPSTQTRILEVNSRIFELSQELNLGGPVDLYAAFGNDRGLLGNGGLHPSNAGYQLMAQTFFDRIRQDFEIQSTTTAPLTTFGPVAHR